MVSIDQLQQDRDRADAGMNRKNIIVDPKVLRKELLKVFYAKGVNKMMEVICSCDMVESKPKMRKVSKGIYINVDAGANLL
jgi:hypothetical protein